MGRNGDRWGDMGMGERDALTGILLRAVDLAAETAEGFAVFFGF